VFFLTLFYFVLFLFCFKVFEMKIDKIIGFATNAEKLESRIKYAGIIKEKTENRINKLLRKGKPEERDLNNLKKISEWAANTVEDKDIKLSRLAAQTLLLISKIPGKHLENVVEGAGKGLRKRDAEILGCSTETFIQASKHEGQHFKKILKYIGEETDYQKVQQNLEFAEAIKNIVSHSKEKLKKKQLKQISSVLNNLIELKKSLETENMLVKQKQSFIIEEIVRKIAENFKDKQEFQELLQKISKEKSDSPFREIFVNSKELD